jgi:hypothetical protein
VKVLVQPKQDSLDAIATDALSSRSVGTLKERLGAECAGHCCILGSCVGSAYMGGQP